MRHRTFLSLAAAVINLKTTKALGLPCRNPYAPAPTR